MGWVIEIRVLLIFANYINQLLKIHSYEKEYPFCLTRFCYFSWCLL